MSAAAKAPSYISQAKCLYCGKCDDNASGEVVKWVQCDNCDKWAHIECTNSIVEQGEDNWSCYVCVAAAAAKLNTPVKGNKHTVRTGFQNQLDVVQVSGSKSKIGRGSSIGSKLKSKASKSSHLKLKLELLEKRKETELEYLDKNYELLRDFSDEESEQDIEDGDNENEVLKSQQLRTANWVEP